MTKCTHGLDTSRSNISTVTYNRGLPQILVVLYCRYTNNCTHAHRAGRMCEMQQTKHMHPNFFARSLKKVPNGNKSKVMGGGGRNFRGEGLGGLGIYGSYIYRLNNLAPDAQI